MSRLLWLTPEVPEPGGRGGAMRAHHLLAGLVRVGITPVVVAPAYPDQEERAVAARPDGVELVLVPRPPSRAAEALRQHVLHPALAWSLLARPWLGWQADVFWARLHGAVAGVLADGVQAAVVEHDFCAAWGRRLPAALPAALATQNATWVQQARDGERLEAARFRALVRGALPRYAWVSTVSDGDAQAYAALGAPEPSVDPNGADVAMLAGLPAGGGDAGRILFTGSLAYGPNGDGARWLIDELFPRIRQAVPDATLAIAGRGAPGALRRAAADAPGVQLLGWVDDLAAELARAAVVVAPLRSGGGTRLKVLEALAAGRAMVATTIGAEGIAVRDGAHLRLADDEAAFADAVATLLRDDAQRARLGAAGRALVAERYEWSAIADRFAAALGEALLRRR
jgi:glycosyltransferase involved in cell wall biosynthesis